MYESKCELIYLCKIESCGCKGQQESSIKLDIVLVCGFNDLLYLPLHHFHFDSDVSHGLKPLPSVAISTSSSDKMPNRADLRLRNCAKSWEESLVTFNIAHFELFCRGELRIRSPPLTW